MDALTGLVLLTLGLALYMAPTLLASYRKHHNIGTIAVVNVLLGWTFIGWVVALAMAAGAVRERSAP